MYYNPEDELEIQCDASQKGLGAALLQKGKPVAYASRALTETEQRYPTIEKEMLAIIYSLETFNHYTFGRNVKVRSDHKPLESILKKSKTCASPRLQRMMMRLQKYNIEISYERGKNMHLADALSRAYLPSTEHPSGEEFEIINNASYLPMSDERIQNLRTATEADEALQILKDIFLRGWPQELTVQDGLVFRGQRIVVPQSLRRDMRQRIHSSHLSVGSCLRRAREACSGLECRLKSKK